MMQIALTPAESRILDDIAIQRFSLPGILLMEHASLALADAACRRLGPPAAGKRVLGLAGAGNNGGDVFAAARHLHNRGYEVLVLVTSPPRHPHETVSPAPPPSDAAQNLAILRRLDVRLELCQDPQEARERLASLPQAAIVLDGLLGTGLRGPVRAPLLGLLQALADDPPGPIVAVDIPSGLSGLTGEPMPQALTAVETVTFGFPKTGLLAEAARPYVGHLVVADIGLPRPLKADPRSFLPSRS